MCPDFVVSDFITDKIKTMTVRAGHRTIRVDLKNEMLADKSGTYCALTPLSVVCMKGCLVHAVDVLVKSAPGNANLRSIIPVAELFARETFFYETVLRELYEFQEEYDLKTDEKFQGAPVMLVSSAAAVEETEALVLQSAWWTPRFVKWDEELTEAHVVAVLKELSRLHALSLAFSRYKPDRRTVFEEGLQDTYLSTFENSTTIRIIQANMDQFLNILDDESVTKRLKKFAEELPQFFESILNDSSGTVLIHGDPTNNFIFGCEKLEELNVSTRVKLTDWQLARFGSPVLDLSLFLLTNSDNSQDWLEIYHTNLGAALQRFKCDVNELFSFDRLEEEWKKYGKFGLALAFLTLKLILLDPKKRPDANNEDLSEEEFLEGFIQQPSEEFIGRMKKIVKYCVDDELI